MKRTQRWQFEAPVDGELREKLQNREPRSPFAPVTDPQILEFVKRIVAVSIPYEDKSPIQGDTCHLFFDTRENGERWRFSEFLRFDGERWVFHHDADMGPHWNQIDITGEPRGSRKQ